MNRLLLAIGGLLVGLLTLMFAAPAVVDWNRYRGVLEEEASRALGRNVRIGGEVNLRLLPVPYLRLEQVRIADATANVGKPLFTADELTMWLSVGKLLGGGLEATAVELRRPVVTLVLDGQGSGSWSSLAAPRAPGGLAPTSIVFDAIRLTDGRVDVLAPSGATRASLEHINGELSAAALEGPYRLTAALAMNGTPFELRLATTKPAEDGAIRVKGTVRNPANRMSAGLDALLTDALGHPRLKGEVTARLPLPEAGARQQSAPAGEARDSEIDLRADLEADTSGMSLGNLALSFEQNGQPQLASGTARVAWSERTDVSVSLSSHWLDLDRIAGGDAIAAPPLERVQALATAVGRVLATQGRTQATVALEQATLGGDVVSGLTATLEQTAGRLAVRGLSAALPGGARIAADGTFDLTGVEPGYEGRLDLNGASLARFLGWAARGDAAAIPGRDGAFSFTGEVMLSRTKIAGRRLALRVGRNALSGEARWTTGNPSEIVVDLEGSELDLSPVLGGGASLPALRDLVRRLAGREEAPGGPLRDAADAQIRLRVDRLVTGRSVFRDAIVDMKLANGSLVMPRLKLTAEEGFGIDLSAEIADLARAGGKGWLSGTASAGTPEGLMALAKVTGLPQTLAPELEMPARAVPAHLALRLLIGPRGPTSLDLLVDGQLGQTRVSTSSRLGPEMPTWRDRATDVSLTLEGQEAVPLVVALANGRGMAPAVPATSARVTLRGIGTPGRGITALGAVAAEEVDATYRGRLGVDETGRMTLAGDLQLGLGDLNRAAALAGYKRHPALAGPVTGRIGVVRSGGRLVLETDGVAIAGSTARGTLTVEPGVADSRRLSGDVRLVTASLPGLLKALAVGEPVGASSPWSEGALDLAALDPVAGSRVNIAVDRLLLSPGVPLADARLDVSTRPGTVEISLAGAKALGGNASGKLLLEKGAAGARMRTEARLTGGRLEALSAGAGAPVASGGLGLVLTAEGTALTPRGLMVALKGSGEVTLEKAGLKQWSPAAIGTAAEAILGLKGEVAPDALRQQLELALAKGGGVALGSPRLGLTIADGTARIAPLVANTPKGRLQAGLSVDLDLQRLAAELRIEPKGTAQPGDQPPKPELPGIAIVYAAPLATMAKAAARLEIEALEREVAVRKVEREVAELERLRRLDEERARQEALRIEEERRQAEERRLQALRQQQLEAARGVAPAPGGEPPAGAPAPPSAGAGGTGATTANEPAAPGAPPASASPPGAATVPAEPPSGAGTIPGSAPAAPVAGATEAPAPPPPKPAQRPRPAQGPARFDPFGGG